MFGVAATDGRDSLLGTPSVAYATKDDGSACASGATRENREATLHRCIDNIAR